MLIEISSQKLGDLKKEASESARKRKNLNYHQDLNDPINRMAHAMNPGTYVQPHKHESPDKREIFFILEGRAAVVEFDDNGNITQHVILDRDNGVYGTEIPARTWHMLIALEPNTLVYEFKDGPYSPIDDKNFASWAPKEVIDGDQSECLAYLNKVRELLNLI